MTGFPVLDVVIGLAFVYLLLALICTTIMEWIAHFKKMRADMLERALEQLLEVNSPDQLLEVKSVQELLDKDKAKNAVITTEFYTHPLIQAARGPTQRPSYISSTVFAKALRDVLSRNQDQMSDGLKQTVQALARKSGAVLPDETELAEWYDLVMERVSGAYKRATQKWILILAAALTIVMNASTVKLASNLWQSPTLRAYVVERARARLEEGPPLQTVEYTEPDNPKPTEPIEPDTTKSPNSVLAEEQALLGDLFGWSGEGTAMSAHPVSWWLLHLLGWALTALAVSLGAPFWFDTLSRFMNLRAAGAPPPKTGETESPKAGDTK